MTGYTFWHGNPATARVCPSVAANGVPHCGYKTQSYINKRRRDKKRKKRHIGITERERERERQTDRDRQTDRQTDRHREAETERE